MTKLTFKILSNKKKIENSPQAPIFEYFLSLNQKPQYIAEKLARTFLTECFNYTEHCHSRTLIIKFNC